MAQQSYNLNPPSRFFLLLEVNRHHSTPFTFLGRSGSIDHPNGQRPGRNHHLPEQASANGLPTHRLFNPAFNLSLLSTRQTEASPKWAIRHPNLSASTSASGSMALARPAVEDVPGARRLFVPAVREVLRYVVQQSVPQGMICRCDR